MAGSADSDDDNRSRSVKKKMASRKFTKKTKEYKELERLFRDGKITPCDKPSTVRLSNPVYMAFTTTQFRSQFNKLKGMYGTCTKEGKFHRRHLLQVSNTTNQLVYCTLQE